MLAEWACVRVEGRGRSWPYALVFEHVTCAANRFAGIVIHCAEPYGFYRETMSKASTLV